MNTFFRLTPVTLALLVAPLSAQNDVIELHDGTTLRKCKVTKWNAKEILFKQGKVNESRASHLVKSVRIEKVREATARTLKDPAGLIGVADENKADPLVASSALFAAAMLFHDTDDPNSMISALGRIDAEYPDSPYAPEFHRYKIRHYLSFKKPKFKDAAAAAIKYGDASRTRVWSGAYSLDAEYWERRVDASSGKMQADRFISSMRDLIGRSSDSAPFVAHAAAADLADTYREQKKYKEARAEYTKLEDQKGTAPDVRARVHLGLGYLSLEDAVTEADKTAHYHEAYKNFLKVYLNAKGAHPELVAEGLYNAAKTCELWNELPTCRQMAGRLRGRLKLRDPYKDTSWARKK